jgi:hypothetical protein
MGDSSIEDEPTWLRQRIERLRKLQVLVSDTTVRCAVED